MLTNDICLLNNRYVHHASTIDALRRHNSLRQNSRDPSLGDIREEDDEEFESVSMYGSSRTNMYSCPPSIYTCHCGGQPDKRTIKMPLHYDEIQTSYSSLGRRTSKRGREFMKCSKITLPPVKEDQQERPSTPVEDYSSDESGISEHDGQDQDCKGGYAVSSEDESHHSKRPSCASSDSALRDSDNLSSLRYVGDSHSAVFLWLHESFSPRLAFARSLPP